MVEFHAGHPGVVFVVAAADKLQHGGLVHGELGQQKLIAFADIGIAAGVDNQAVEGHVRVLHAADILADHAVLEGFRQVGKLPDRGVVRIVGAEGGGLALNGGADLVETDHVVQIQVQHEVAVLSRMADHESNLAELGDGLRYRRAGYAQRGGNLVHIQLGSRAYAQSHDFVIYELGHQVAKLRVRVGVDVFPQLIAVHIRHLPFDPIITKKKGLYKTFSPLRIKIN